MVKQKSQGKDKKKGSQFVIRVDKSERDAFVALCERQDTSAAREIRRFMRERVAAHANDALLPPVPTENLSGSDAGGDQSKPAAATGPAAATDAPVVVAPASKRKRLSQKLV